MPASKSLPPPYHRSLAAWRELLIQTVAHNYSKLLSEEKLLFFFEFNNILSAGFNEPFASSHYIKQIDSAVEKIANLIDSFYNDRQTAFMFTLSANSTFSSVLLHSHHIVHLPFICWGAGIKK